MHSFKFKGALALLSQVSFNDDVRFGNNCLRLKYELQNPKFGFSRHKSIVLKFFVLETSGAFGVVDDRFAVEGVDNDWVWYSSDQGIPHVSHVVFITKENFPLLLKSAKY
jgi:hypothetical protein